MAVEPDSSLSKRNTPVLAYFLSIAILGSFTALGGPSLPSLAENTSSTLGQISLYFVLGSLGYLLGSLIGGRAYDHLPGNRLLSVSLLVVAASGALIPITHTLWWLLAAQFCLGFAQGVNDVGCNTLLLWAHGKEAGPYVNALHFSFGVGTFIAPLVLAGILSLEGSFEWAFWVFTGLSFPLAAWLWNLPDSTPMTTGKSAVKTPDGFFPAAWLALAFLFYVGAEIGLGDWIYTYALTRGLGTTISAAYLTSAFWGIFTAGRLLGVWISTRLRPAPILTADVLGCLLSVSLIALWPDSTAALWLGTLGCGLFMASIFPSMLTLAGERLEISGTVTGWFLVGGGAGSMILPWIIGQAFVQAGTAALPVAVLLATALTGMAVFLFTSRTVESA